MDDKQPHEVIDVCPGQVVEIEDFNNDTGIYIEVQEDCLTRNGLKDGDYVEVTLRKYGFQP